MRIAGVSVLLLCQASAAGGTGFPQSTPTGTPECETTSRFTHIHAIKWNLAGTALPCEHTLRPNAVVVVTIEGANPAVARYALSSRTVRDAMSTWASTPVQGGAPSAAAPATPAAPVKLADLPQASAPVQRGIAQDPSALAMAQLTATERREYELTLPLIHARAFIERATRNFGELTGAHHPDLCGGGSPPAIQPDNFWQVASAVGSLHAAVLESFRDVIPPVTAAGVTGSQQCIARLLETGMWGGLILRGATQAASTFSSTRARIEALGKEALAHSQKLAALPLDGARTQDVAPLIEEREGLLTALAQIGEHSESLLRADLADDVLASVMRAVADASRMVDIIQASQHSVVLELPLDGHRGRSRDVVLTWESLRVDVPIAAGSRTVLVDRFRGFLLNVTGSAGFVGTRHLEILRKAAFDAEGMVVADTVILVPNRTVVLGPGLSTGLSLSYHWRNGFYAGLGTDILLLNTTESAQATRIVAPVLHLGRDDTRFFFGIALGPVDGFALENDERVRVPATAAIPDHLIVKNSRSGPVQLYLGIVVGQASLDPSRLRN